MYWLWIYFGRKSNLGCQINYQGRYLHEVGNSCSQKFMVSITQITQIIVSDYCIYYIVYSSFILCKLQVYMSSNGVYTLISSAKFGIKL